MDNIIIMFRYIYNVFSYTNQNKDVVDNEKITIDNTIDETTNDNITTNDNTTNDNTTNELNNKYKYEYELYDDHMNTDVLCDKVREIINESYNRSGRAFSNRSRRKLKSLISGRIFIKDNILKGIHYTGKPFGYYQDDNFEIKMIARVIHKNPKLFKTIESRDHKNEYHRMLLLRAYEYYKDQCNIIYGNEHFIKNSDINELIDRTYSRYKCDNNVLFVVDNTNITDIKRRCYCNYMKFLSKIAGFCDFALFDGLLIRKIKICDDNWIIESDNDDIKNDIIFLSDNDYNENIMELKWMKSILFFIRFENQDLTNEKHLNGDPITLIKKMSNRRNSRVLNFLDNDIDFSCLSNGDVHTDMDIKKMYDVFMKNVPSKQIVVDDVNDNNDNNNNDNNNNDYDITKYIAW
jgi:hypothetical protein